LENEINKKSKVLDKISKAKTKAELELNAIVKNPNAKFDGLHDMLRNISEEILPIVEMDNVISSK
jgi:hypothetical protein